MKRIIVIFFIAFSVIVQAQPTISNNGMFYRSLAENGLLNGLVSLWEFDETSGTTAYDAHGSNDGTNYGATVDQTGLLSRSYSFNGTSNNVRITHNSSINFDAYADSYSVSMWIKFITTSNSRSIIEKRPPGSGQGSEFPIAIRLNSAKLIITSVYDGANAVSIVSNVTPNTTTWYHIVSVVDQSDTKLKLYVNNALFEGAISSLVESTASSADIYIGSNATTGYINAYCDQTAIWNRALTATEVAALYNSGNGIFYIDFTAYIKKMYDNLIPLQFKPLDIEIPLRIAS